MGSSNGFWGGVAQGVTNAQNIMTDAAREDLIRAQAAELREKSAANEAMAKWIEGGPGYGLRDPQARPADATSTSGDSSTRAGSITPMQKVGENYTDDPAFAQSMADSQAFETGEDVTPQTAYKVAGAGIYSDPAQAIDAGQQMKADQLASRSPKSATVAGDAYGDYRRNAAPKILAGFIRAGKLHEAKAFLDFTRDQEGEQYARDWLAAGKAVEAGDYEGAIPMLTRLYNQAVPDGRQVGWESLGNGNYRVTHVDQDTGQIVGQRDFTAPDLSRFALDALSPAKRIENLVALQKEQRLEDRKIRLQDALETRRDLRSAAREDSRDERLQESINAASERQQKSIDAAATRQQNALDNRGGLTQAQERGNAEIDAARSTVAGMSPQDIMHRTAKTTATGRLNEDYDPTLAHQVTLANRRKTGDDPEFDNRQAKAAPSQQPVQSRFASDPAMKGLRMGKKAPDGFEVIDGSGKLVGHYH